MAASRTLTINITGDSKDAQRAFSSLDKSVDQSEGRLSALGSKISPGLALAATAVAAGAALALKGAYNAAVESAKVASETERVIRTTGASAWTTADQIGDLAGSISDLTGKDDELIQSGANLLLTFTKIRNETGAGNDAFDRATKAALDMSVALGTDMAGASIQVGKALNNPIQGLTALSRAGVTFTAEQKEQIKTLMETGDVLGAQKVILNELETEFAGAAEAAKTPIEALQTKLGNFQEEVGARLIPIVSGGVDALEFLGGAFTRLPGPVQTAAIAIAGIGASSMAVIPLVAKLAEIFSPVASAVKTAMDSAKLAVAGLAEKMGASTGMALGLGTALTTGIGGALAAAGVAFAGFAIVQQINAAKAAEQKKRADEYTEAIQRQTGELQTNINETTGKMIADSKIGQIAQETSLNVGLLSTAILTSGDSLDRFQSSWKDGDWSTLKDTLRDAASGGDAFATEILRLRDSGEITNDQMIDLVTTSDSLSDAFVTGSEAAATEASAVTAVGDANQTAASKAAEHAQNIRDVATALREQTDPYFAVISTSEKLNKAQADYAQLVLAGKDGTDEANTAYRAMVDAGFAAAGATLDLSAKQADGTVTASDLQTQMDLLRRFGIDPNTESGRALSAQLYSASLTAGSLGAAVDNLAGKRIVIPIETFGFDRAFGELVLLQGKIREVTSLGVTAGVSPYLARGYADGGMVGDGFFTVGEEGPELGYKSGSGVRIFSNPDSARMIANTSSSSSTTNVVINMPPGSDGADVVNALRRYQDRNGPLPLRVA